MQFLMILYSLQWPDEPSLGNKISESGYLLLPSHDMSELFFQRIKSSKQPNQRNEPS